MMAKQLNRVLVAATNEELARLRTTFAHQELSGWQMVEADTLEKGRFLVQMNPGEVLLLDASLYPLSDPSSIAWLSEQGQVTTLFVSPMIPPLILEALNHGAHQWLPRELALEAPEVLAAILDRLNLLSRCREDVHHNADALANCREHINRLAHLLWEVTPGAGNRWFTQRHVLERLEEELVRVHRHGGPLTVVLGELNPDATSRLTEGDRQKLVTWATEEIQRCKRRSDIAGQYGLRNFLMVLPRVNEEEAQSCCQRLKTVLEHAGQREPFSPMHFHFGLASYSPEVTTLPALLSQAEQNLKRALKEGTEQEDG